MERQSNRNHRHYLHEGDFQRPAWAELALSFLARLCTLKMVFSMRETWDASGGLPLWRGLSGGMVGPSAPGDPWARVTQASPRFCCLAGLVGVEVGECGWLTAGSGRGRWRFVAGRFEGGALSLSVTSTVFSAEVAGAEDELGWEESCNDSEEAAVLWRVLPAAAAAYVREDALKVSLALALASGKARC